LYLTISPANTPVVASNFEAHQLSRAPMTVNVSTGVTGGPYTLVDAKVTSFGYPQYAAGWSSPIGTQYAAYSPLYTAAAPTVSHTAAGNITLTWPAPTADAASFQRQAVVSYTVQDGSGTQKS